MHERLVEGGVLFAVVPAFGTDAVFGEPFPLYLDEWQADLDGGRLFDRRSATTTGIRCTGT